jgi:lipopolysaccharide transport system ATP-binding protein
MSADNAIEVRNLGKRFEIGSHRGGYQLLTETISERFKKIGRQPEQREFWALRDIDFEVERGGTLGIIGHNGAGKSTLLKILSRITPPTIGQARLRGRVGALLEVGTGFHPELTGRENVFLNGAILNMSRREIEGKFDEIVEFADIGAFIDTPVKRYSSGMQLRLAFSVAAHLEPEILIIDEVLSVGDMAFQRKCLGRMESATEEGRTVLFISHNLQAVRRLCDRAILLAEGRMRAEGQVDDVIDAYVSDTRADWELNLRERRQRWGNGKLRFTDLHLERRGRVIDSPSSGEDFDIVLTYETADGNQLYGVNFGVTINDMADSLPLINLYSETVGTTFSNVPPRGQVRCRVVRCPLPAGQYYFTLTSDSDGEQLDGINGAGEITITGGDFYGTGTEPPPGHRTVLVDNEWSVAEERGDEAAEPSRSPVDTSDTVQSATGRAD